MWAFLYALSLNVHLVKVHHRPILAILFWSSKEGDCNQPQKQSTTRDRLVSLGTCIGKFTRAKEEDEQYTYIFFIIRSAGGSCYVERSRTSKHDLFLYTISYICIDLNVEKSLGSEIRCGEELLWNCRRSDQNEGVVSVLNLLRKWYVSLTIYAYYKWLRCRDLYHVWMLILRPIALRLIL